MRASVQPFLSKSKKCPRCQGANHKKTVGLFYVGDPANYALAFHWERSDKSFMGAKGRLLLFVLTFASSVDSDSAFAQSWVMTSAPITNWVSVAMSADGSKIAAAVRGTWSGDGYPGPIYFSEDSGTNWVQTSAPLTNWTSVAISADGAKVVACTGNGDGSALFVSTNSGSTWLDRTPTSTWG